MDTKVKFNVGTVSYEAELRNSGYTARAKKPRASVWEADGSVPEAEVVLGPVAKALGAPTIHTVRGAFPALDKAWDAYNKSVVEVKRAVLFGALKALAPVNPQAAYFRENMDQIKFSRKAGCRCGCSPGFVLPGLASHQDIDLFVNVAVLV